MGITASPDRSDLGTDQEAPRTKWGWFVALGIFALLAGFISFGNLFLATVVSVLYVGIMMLLAGIAQLIQAFQVRKWRGFLFWFLGGLIYAVAGLFAFVNPTLAASALTLLLAISLVAVGVLRCIIGIRSRPLRGWGWVVASGIVTILVGLIVGFGWPSNALWVLGIFLAIDLTFMGAAMLALGLILRTERSSQEAP